MKIVYIAGYGRSGSTALDIFMAKKDEKIFGTGELTYLLDDLANGKLCSCGVRYSRCDVWNYVGSANFTDSDASFMRSVEVRNGLFDFFKVPSYSKDESSRYSNITLKILKGLDQFSVVIDSSKTAHDAFWRPWLLHDTVGLDVYVIHLKKSLVGVLKSSIKGSNWAVESNGKAVSRSCAHRVARSFVGWFMGNYQARRMKKLLGDSRYMFLEYSDMVNDPKRVFRSIGRLIDDDFSLHADNIAAGAEFDMIDVHNVGGNRLRLAESICLKKRHE